MTEWIDPRYADVIAAMRRAQAARKGPNDTGPLRTRGFVLPAK
jgi:hypothetical protein